MKIVLFQNQEPVYYQREKLNIRCSYDVFSFYYEEDLLKKLGCSPVAAKNIIFKPKYLKELTEKMNESSEKTNLIPSKIWVDS